MDRPFGISDEEHERRMGAARDRAEWELGDGSWAGVIVGAYLYPDQDESSLTAEKAAIDAGERISADTEWALRRVTG